MLSNWSLREFSLSIHGGRVLGKNLLATLVFILLTQFNAFAAVSGDTEVQLTLATIAYQAKNYKEAKKTLSTVLKSEPKNVNALELLALSQRALNEDDQASKTYESLVKLGPKDKRAAYGFELGTIRYKQKKLGDARRYFEYAAKSNFNAGTSHFFLGVMDFSDKEWRGARHHFTASLTYSDSKPMTPITRYYLANTYAQLGKSDAALINYNTAKEAVESEPNFNPTDNDSMTGNIRKNALKELKALDKGSKYISLTYMNQFDSNVQTNPSEVDNAVALSSQRSGKSILSISAGASTSPTDIVQISPSFNFYTNYNYNYLARDYNFMSFTPALYVLYKPYKQLSGGLKADGVFSMKNTLDATESKRNLKFRPFSLTGDVGPVGKYELTPRISLAAETVWRPKRFYTDPASGTTRRSGGGLLAKLSGEFISGLWWWNPGGYASYEWDYPSGSDFRMYAWGGGASNAVQFTDKFTLTGYFDLLSTNYYQTTPPIRSDFNLNFRVAGSYVLTDHWTAIADMSYTNNDSTLSQTYKYNRFVTSGGAVYNF